MRSRSDVSLLLLVLALLTLVVVALAAEAGTSRPRSPGAFQRAAAGLGGSSTVGVSWSFFAFDPRLERECENELWPIPGLHCPNPVHGTGVAGLSPARTIAPAVGSP